MILKNILAFFCLMGFFVTPVFSQDFHPGVSQHSGVSPEAVQRDSNFLGNIIVKFNPTLILTGLGAVGEYGAIIQFPIERTQGQSGVFKNMDAFVGGGYNTSFDMDTPSKNPNGTGYTVRGGVYGYFKGKYLSLQFFYRRWDIKGIYDVDYTPDGSQDNILDPFALIGVNSNTPIQFLENATVSVYSFDIVYGKQYINQHKLARIFVEWYIGVGMRFKTISLEELGYYDPNTFVSSGVPGTYYPSRSPKYFPETSTLPDIKAGFMVGFIL